MARGAIGGKKLEKKRRKRKGIHTKNCNSGNKNSKTYNKHYRGQGR